MIAATRLRDGVLGILQLNNDTTTLSRFRVWESINMAVRQITTVVSPDVVDVVVKSRVFDLVSGTRFYQFPDDMLRLVAVQVNYDGDLSNPNTYPYDCCFDISRDGSSLSYHYRTALKWCPKFYLVENGIGIRPTPQTDQTNGLRLRYVYSHPEISLSQNCLLRPAMERAVILSAAQLCCLVDAYNLELADMLGKQLEAELQRWQV